MTRNLLAFLLALACITPTRAAVTLGSTATVSFGDISTIAGLTEMSWALTVTLTASCCGATSFLLGQWATTNASAAFTVRTADTDELELCWGQGDGGYRCDKTSDLNLTNGSTYRMVGTLTEFGGGGSKDIDLWVNGVSKSLTVTLTPGPICCTVADSAEQVSVGKMLNRSEDGIQGSYSDFALWSVKVPAWFAEAYGKGLSPLAYRTGGILYAPLVNVNSDGLREVWGGIASTNSSGTTATHPSMYRPSQ